MASPQVENGYTRIANELLEALVLASLSGSELNICLIIIRQTYGFNKKEDAISLSQFFEKTKYSKQGIVNALQSLKAKNIILSKKGFRGMNIWKINKDYTSWVVNSSVLVKNNRLVNSTLTTSQPYLTPLVNSSLHTKDIPKDIKQNKEKIKKTLKQLREDLKIKTF